MTEISSLYNTDKHYQTDFHLHDEFMLIIPEKGLMNVTEGDSGISGSAMRNQFAMVKSLRPHATETTTQTQSHHTLYGSPDYMTYALQLGQAKQNSLECLPDFGIWSLTPFMRYQLISHRELGLQKPSLLRQMQQEKTIQLILLEAVNIAAASPSLIAGYIAHERGDMLAKRVAQYLIDHLEEPLKQDDLAHVFQLSKRHISRVFRSHFGETLHDFLIRQRMIRAAELLRNTSLSVLEVAGRLGFDSASHFSLLFRRYHQETPLRWRQVQRTRMI
ncbi:helix-turn-helix domain-containing protein [Rouxiella sp. Mn2063]|uniref:helix-turn-helix domain-containing protein n=1 Tax=Rouxiella sp. Mn2063 TaxID=3395262 RepID=UPI003BBAACDA